VAVAELHRVSYAYRDADGLALRAVSVCLAPGRVVSVLGPSGSGKSTFLRALAGLVPHFHGGRLSGRVEVGGLDTRHHAPHELAATVATLFQDPEDQVVFTRVLNEVAFGLENLGTPPSEIESRALAALEAVDAAHLAGRRVTELSGGELQRVCLAATFAVEPKLLLLDEPISQLDPDGAEAAVRIAVELARARGTAVVLTEQRPALPLEISDRILFFEDGRIAFDGPAAAAREWLAASRPDYVDEPSPPDANAGGGPVCRLRDVAFAYEDSLHVVDGAELELRRGEVVALEGPNGCGKTTLAKLAAGLLEPARGEVERNGRATYLLQDPGRYLFTERVDDEVALAAPLDAATRAIAAVGLAGQEHRHPRDLSSGERERLALAAVLAPEPDLLVLDEPTRGVDPERKAELARLLRTEAAERATLVVTHDQAFATAVADRVVSLAPVHEAARV
jgi:energy-coupling factor transporter ATP-binding protein EcfA2